MVRLTLIARTRDGLPLAEGLDADKEHEMYAYKSQAKVGGDPGHPGGGRRDRAAPPQPHLPPVHHVLRPIHAHIQPPCCHHRPPP